MFFSRITLEDKIGTEYEPYIYAALYSSKVMLTVCSSKENIEAVWVKNEWSRFLSLRQNDTSKTVLPLYFDMEKYDLPDEFALLSSYDMTVDGFTEELLRGIKKLIPLPIMKAKRRKLILKTTGITLATIVLVVGIAAAIIVPKELENRRIQAEEAALVAANEEAYLSAMALFDSADYTAAEEAFKELGDYKDSAHMAERCPIQPDYDAAMKLYYDGRYAEATWAFEKLGDYEDSAEQKEKAKLSWRKCLATVAMNNQVQLFSYGEYYINSNGSVDVISGKSGTSNKNTGVNVVSISSGKQLFALHEDGVLDNISQNGNIDEKQWEDIIQITPFFEGTNVALKSDGTVVFGEFASVNYQNDFWLKGCADWENIVMLSSSYLQTSSGIYGAALAGVDVEGDVHLCYWDGFDVYKQTFMDYSDVCTDIKAIDICDSGSYPGDKDSYINAVAIRNDGKIASFINGKVSVEDAKGVIDVQITNGIFYKLYSNGDLHSYDIYNNCSKGTILTDVVKLFDDYLITRSGSVYTLGKSYDSVDDKGCISVGVKGCIYDEWLAKMR